MYHVTLLTDLRRTPLRETLVQRGCVVEGIHYSTFPQSLPLAPLMVADVVICFPIADEHFRSGYITYSKARQMESELRALSDEVCMGDGRKWKAVPFMSLVDEMEMTGLFYDVRGSSGSVISYYGDEQAYRHIKNAITTYKQKVVAGFDNLGFLVTYKNGRLRVGPALGGKTDLENEFYRSKADKTRSNRSRVVTVDRDLYGVQYEVEQLEFLINWPKTNEADLQKFFEENPHFLASPTQAIPLPHPRFPINDQESLIPDFVLRPVTHPHRDSRWQVLDLKMPSAKLLSGKGRRVRFGAEVADAIVQLNDYTEYFRNPSNKDVIESILSHHLRFPSKAVLIGRMPRQEDVEALELAQSREPAVRIITYDEILDSQKQFLALLSKD